MTRIPEHVSRTRFTRRLAFYEDPEIVALLEQLAWGDGVSVAAAMRGACRYYLRAYDLIPDEDEV